MTDKAGEDNTKELGRGESTRLLQISEPDLAELERLLPDICFDAAAHVGEGPAANRLRVQIRRIREIVTNVRWNYGPWSDITIIPADGDST